VAHFREAFLSDLASLVQAGLPLERALQVLADSAAGEAARRLAAALRQAVRAGLPLSTAMQARPDAFSRLHVSSVRAAELGGGLDACLARLVEHEARAQALRERVLGALLYPAILLVVAALSIAAILVWVVPQFTQLFADAGRPLPLATRVVLGAAELVRSLWWAFLAAPVALALLARAQLATPEGRARLGALLLGLPLAGRIVRRVEMARFARALSALLAGGVPLLTAASIARDVLSNEVMRGAVDLALESLRAGRGLSGPLVASGAFPDIALQMVRIGEQAGRLDAVLARAAELCEREVAAETARALALLEPVLVVVLGALIGGVVLSLLAAVVAVNDLPLL
jgi:general secretion pathway protein F